MKKALKKWILRLTVSGIFIASILVIIILNPALTYAYITSHGNFNVYSSKPIDKKFFSDLDLASVLIKKSEFYQPGKKLDICLNDGALLPELMKAIRGEAFGWGFSNKVVLGGNANYRSGYVEINGYTWNLSQLLAHEMTHCMQFEKRGLWKSNPLANIPEWKWEGYPEYISRQGKDQRDLFKNIERLKKTEQTEHNGWIQFSDATGTVIHYYKHWLLIQYCMDIKKMDYSIVLKDSVEENKILNEMRQWYEAQTKSKACTLN